MGQTESTLQQIPTSITGEQFKASDLDFYSLLRRQGNEGRLFFNQRRAIIMDVEAMGTLRQQLVESVGQDMARGMLTRFGYAQGYKDAETLSQTFEWETDDDWLTAGSLLHILEGVAYVEIEDASYNHETGDFYMRGIWRNSFEAEEHLDQHGPGNQPVCWILAGYASGYATRFLGRKVLAIESECAGQGHSQCRFEIKPVEEWGAKAKPYLQALESTNNVGAGADISTLNSIIDGLPQSVYRIDTEGRITFGNRAYLNELGMSLQECLGKTAYDFFPKEQADKFTADDRQVIETGQILETVEGHRVPATGQIEYVQTVKIPVRDATGQIVGVQGIFWDVTEREMTRQALTKQAAELETVAEVGTIVATVRETKELLQTVADLTKERFNLYHAHIYLINPAGDTLNLAAGAGDVGRQMVAEQWSIPLAQKQSIVARAAQTGQGLIVNDVRQDAHFFQNPLLPDTRAELAVPIIIAGNVLGVLDVQADAVNHFTKEDLRIQQTLAAQVAVALENARLFEAQRKAVAEMEEQARRLTLLNKMGAELNQAGTVKEVLDIASVVAHSVIDSTRVSVAILDELGQEFELYALSGPEGAFPVGSHVPVANTAVGLSVREERVLVNQNITQSDLLDLQELAQQGLRSVMNAPLVVRGSKIIGTLNVGSKESNAFSQQDEALIRQIAALLAATIENRRLFEQVQARARREKILREVTARVRGSADVDTIMRTAAQQVGRALGRPAFVYLDKDSDEKAQE